MIWFNPEFLPITEHTTPWHTYQHPKEQCLWHSRPESCFADRHLDWADRSANWSWDLDRWKTARVFEQRLLRAGRHSKSSTYETSFNAHAHPRGRATACPVHCGEGGGAGSRVPRSASAKPCCSDDSPPLPGPVATRFLSSSGCTSAPRIPAPRRLSSHVWGAAGGKSPELLPLWGTRHCIPFTGRVSCVSALAFSSKATREQA